MISLAPLCDLPALESERLLLRRLCMRDAPDIYDYSRDAEVARHVLWTAHTSPSESRSYIRYMLRRYRLGEPSSWGIVLKLSLIHIDFQVCQVMFFLCAALCPKRDGGAIILW